MLVYKLFFFSIQPIKTHRLVMFYRFILRKGINVDGLNTNKELIYFTKGKINSEKIVDPRFLESG